MRRMNLNPDQRRELAQRCEIAPDYLYQILTRRKVASPRLCVRLEVESGGAVRRQDLYPDTWQTIWPELAEISKQKQPEALDGQALSAIENGVA